MSQQFEARPEAPENNTAVESSAINYLALSENESGGYGNLSDDSSTKTSDSSTSGLPDIEIDFNPSGDSGKSAWNGSDMENSGFDNGGVVKALPESGNGTEPGSISGDSTVKTMPDDGGDLEHAEIQNGPVVKTMPDDGGDLEHTEIQNGPVVKTMPDDGGDLEHAEIQNGPVVKTMPEDGGGMVNGEVRPHVIEENPQGKPEPELRHNESAVSESYDKKPADDAGDKGEGQISEGQDKADDGRNAEDESLEQNDQNFDPEDKVEDKAEEGQEAQSEKLAKLEKAMDQLPEGPVSEIFEEALQGMATGELDVEALQELTTPGAAQMIDLYRGQSDGNPEAAAALESINEAQSVLAEEFGIDLDISRSGITMSEMGGAHAFNATVSIPREGNPDSYEQFTAGFAGPIVRDLKMSEAMARFQDRLTR